MRAGNKCSVEVMVPRNTWRSGLITCEEEPSRHNLVYKPCRGRCVAQKHFCGSKCVSLRQTRHSLGLFCAEISCWRTTPDGQM
ncbi:hypothetical protein K1T71_008844 [Dendrolimus kikuchii]|uniref:Uncharacterized protein n=1 Tax=Dendrolimus kikuchii TaxID=765133 RepID=A0ACC1CW31_9NEOP|nr:hypothetical protein K1T71_008844 [Dendrolimus kikuchii]